jgi:hypothetical protein
VADAREKGWGCGLILVRYRLGSGDADGESNLMEATCAIYSSRCPHKTDYLADADERVAKYGTDE